jgi:tetratricopeptide (TPR) repeat protein
MDRDEGMHDQDWEPYDLDELMGRLGSSEEDERAEARVEFGGLLYTIGLYEEALATVAAALDHFEERGNLLGVAVCHRAAGTVLRAAGDPGGSAERFLRAAGAFHALDMTDAAADAEAARGVALARAGERVGAVEWMRRAAAGYLRAGNPGLAGSALAAAADFTVDVDDYDTAHAMLADARRLLADADRLHDAARCEAQQGYLLVLQGRPAEAVSVVRSARSSLALGPGAATDVALCERRLAAASRELGRFDEALAALLAARDAYEAAGDPMQVRVCDVEIGVVMRARGWNEDAIAKLEAVLPDLPAAGLGPVVEAVCRFNLGSARHAAGEDAAARLHLAAAHTLYRDLGTRRRVADCELALAAVDLTAGDLQGATHRIREARRTYVDLGLPVDVADCDDAAGEASTGQGRYADAVRLHRAALGVFEARDLLPAAANCHRRLGHALDHLGRHAEARDHYLEARRAFDSMAMSLDAAACDVALFHVLGAAGEVEAAVRHLEAAETAYRLEGRGWDESRHARLVEDVRAGTLETHDHGPREKGEAA